MTPDPARLEALLAETAWVRTLARRLCSDSAAADDLVQDTWLAALRHRPDDRASPRAWLGKVLVNLHLARRRSEANRGARERSAAREEGLPSSSDVVERVQSSRVLVEHVLELEEPYRSAVLARFFDGLSAEEIARREGLPSSTIRTRIQRGIEKLRARLQREKGADWIAALVPLARVDSSVGATGVGLSGGLAMATGTKLALGLCAAGLCAWILWPHAPKPSPAGDLHAQVAESSATSMEAESAGLERTALGLPSVHPSELEVTPPAVAAPGIAVGTIRGNVLRNSAPGTEEIPGIEVTLHTDLGPYDSSSLSVLARQTSDAQGGFAFKNLQPGNYSLRARIRNAVHESRATLEPDQPGKWVGISFGASGIHGRIHDVNGAPLADCRLYLEDICIGNDNYEWGTQQRQAATTDERGAYEFEELPRDNYRLWLVPQGERNVGEWPYRNCVIRLADGDDVQLDVGSSTGAPHWRGVLRTRSGKAVEYAGSIELKCTADLPTGSSIETVVHRLFPPDGEFDIPLDPGKWSVTLGTSSVIGFEEIAVPAAGLERDLILRGIRLTGTVSNAQTHRPLHVRSGSLIVQGRKADNQAFSVLIDADGRYVVDNLEPGEWIINSTPMRLDAPGESVTLQLFESEAEHTLDLEVRVP